MKPNILKNKNEYLILFDGFLWAILCELFSGDDLGHFQFGTYWTKAYHLGLLELHELKG